jgi:hypothetical protein
MRRNGGSAGSATDPSSANGAAISPDAGTPIWESRPRDLASPVSEHFHGI